MLSVNVQVGSQLYLVCAENKQEGLLTVSPSLRFSTVKNGTVMELSDTMSMVCLFPEVVLY